MKILTTAGKCVLLWIALYIGQMLGGMISTALLHPQIPKLTMDGPFGTLDGLAAATAGYAIVMAQLAPRLRGSFWMRAGAQFVILYIVGSILSEIEALWCNAYLKLPAAILAMLPLTAFVQAVIGTLVAAALWRGKDEAADSFPGLWWKLLVIIPIYIVFYFGAGALIAWQSADVRAYYEQGGHIDNGHLVLVQGGRGLIWGLTAFVAVRQLTGKKWSRALLTGLAFSVLMAIVLLLPAGFMPWPVRRMHLMEIASSNLLFGILAGSILMMGMKPRAQAAIAQRQEG